MESLGPDAQSFIVKVWVEDAVETADRNVWHGHITHVPSGIRRYVRNLDDIADFIVPYLEQMGVQPSSWQRVRRWLVRQGHATRPES